MRMANTTESAQGLGELQQLRIALVHYWYVRRRGGERVLDVLAEMFPQADLYIMVAEPKSMPPATAALKLTTSFLQKIPGAKRHYRKMMPLFPLALEQFNLNAYDLVISHEAGPAKGVLTRTRTCHVNYSHSPMRHIWEMYHEYRNEAPLGALGRAVYALSSNYLRQWDYAAAARVNHFIASSRNGALRIRKYYNRDAEIVYPPVDVSSFSPGEDGREDFYLVVSPLVIYKRVDLAIAACNALGRRLVIIGQGEEEGSLRKMAGRNVEFLGFQPDSIVREHYRKCRAFLFPGEEDIGLTPVEAQASGTPVIAYGAGGALETVRGFYPDDGFQPGASGVFFRHQTVDNMASAIRAFEIAEERFNRGAVAAHAAQFSAENFKLEMARALARVYADFASDTLGRNRAYAVSGR
jgi:glycosyltransferase involved in cell wall biosynthesis